MSREEQWIRLRQLVQAGYITVRPNPALYSEIPEMAELSRHIYDRVAQYLGIESSPGSPGVSNIWDYVYSPHTVPEEEIQYREIDRQYVSPPRDWSEPAVAISMADIERMLQLARQRAPGFRYRHGNVEIQTSMDGTWQIRTFDEETRGISEWMTLEQHRIEVRTDPGGLPLTELRISGVYRQPDGTWMQLMLTQQYNEEQMAQFRQGLQNQWEEAAGAMNRTIVGFGMAAAQVVEAMVPLRDQFAGYNAIQIVGPGYSTQEITSKSRKKAADLLKSLCTEEQWKVWKSSKYLPVTINYHGRERHFRITTNTVYGIWEYNAEGRVIGSYCAVPEDMGNIPVEDRMANLLLHLQYAPDVFFGVANMGLHPQPVINSFVPPIENPRGVSPLSVVIDDTPTAIDENGNPVQDHV